MCRVSRAVCFPTFVLDRENKKKEGRESSVLCGRGLLDLGATTKTYQVQHIIHIILGM